MCRRIIQGVVSLLAVASAACASSRDPWTAPSLQHARTTVAVRNDAPEDMAVYAVNAVGARARLGTIMRASNRDFVIPPGVLSRWGVQLLVHPLGGGPERVMSCPEIRPGSALRLDLEGNAMASSCSMQ